MMIPCCFLFKKTPGSLQAFSGIIFALFAALFSTFDPVVYQFGKNDVSF